jgi:hypothetical protein
MSFEIRTADDLLDRLARDVAGGEPEPEPEPVIERPRPRVRDAAAGGGSSRLDRGMLLRAAWPPGELEG